MEKMLEVGQIVWAKVRGYPWWPGIVRRGLSYFRLLKYTKTI